MGRLRHARNQQYHAASRENLCQRGTLPGHLLPVRRGLRSQLQRQEGQVSVAGRYRSPAPVAFRACFFCTPLCRIAAWSSDFFAPCPILLASELSLCLFFWTAGTMSFDQVPPANPRG